ncbi:GNAT family N-acetyltransferase [Legionella longbeachae]|uniref:GNAT family N-acetyltransferase n=1 Tax=Legionella longbeachae TaxID=450 RepID=UPI0018D47A11|nr:GNAT family N-acetyltransferase [Legionella longbeachae]HBD7398724.1 GNAT family N-acetyltransferase [Legionella pneumophila]
MTYSNEQWKQRASSETQPKFWLAFKDEKAIGMIGAGVDPKDRYNLIAMWVEPASRGLGIADHLIDAVKFGIKKNPYIQFKTK